MKCELNVGVGTEEGDRYRISIFGLKIPLNIFQKEDIYEQTWVSWGFVYFDRFIHFNWGRKTKIVEMPWGYGSCVINKVLSWDGKWIDDKGKDYRQKECPYLDDREIKKYPYTYRLKNGDVQNVTATIHTDLRVWWWKMFHWLPIFMSPIIPFKIINKCIAVDFSDEVGERSGSWKGGTIGCGYKMKKNETPYQCLRRMEIEREF